MNTKHAENESGNECSLCKDSFTSAKELKKHIDDHIKEIEGLDNSVTYKRLGLVYMQSM